MISRYLSIPVLAAGALLAACAPAPAPAGASAEYASPEYGYAFRYPDTLDLHVYVPEHVAVGRETEGGFDAAVEVGVFVASEDAPAGYGSFVIDRAQTLCAADGPGLSLRCTDVQQRMPFETETGLTGEVFYLKHETVEVPSGRVTAESGRGPFIALDLSMKVAAGRHAVLLIRPPATLDPAAVDTGLVRGVAESVRVDRVESH